MSRTVIKIENLSKVYRLGEVGTGTISHDLNRFFAKIRGKEDPFAKVGSVNDRTQKAVKGEMVRALSDINLEIREGEVLGIIGKNGAGKSTLLKILSRITSPTTGSYKIKGRMASLLEVGTGFNPELTGRENIYMNGTIMGMRKWEIDRKLDEIVEFSGVAKYLDTPVKRYSSGMTVRLGFAVAAHLESEILVVDEVLAVGDAEFQKKAIGKMQEVSQGQGRTVLFVSHNMGAVESLCTTGLIMINGTIDYTGTASNAIQKYISTGNSISSHYCNPSPRNDSDILEISVYNLKKQLTNTFAFTDSVTLSFKIKIDAIHMEAILGIRIKDQKERNVFSSQCKIKEYVSSPGIHIIQVIIPPKVLVPNSYTVVSGLHIVNTELIRQTEAVSFQIEETGSDFYQYAGNDYGCVFVDCKWFN